ncbi:hypothetical protein HZU73_06823 [Apis mellifera caucasica]|nr:hypothetical protein HZU73_06823 [Apis mellifera caucasica]
MKVNRDNNNRHYLPSFNRRIYGARVHRDEEEVEEEEEEEEEEEDATRRSRIESREANLWRLECVPDAWRIARS